MILEFHARETRDPPIQPIRFPLKIRWYIIQFKPWTTWADVRHNLRYLVRG